MKCAEIQFLQCGASGNDRIATARGTCYNEKAYTADAKRARTDFARESANEFASFCVCVV